VWGYEYAHKGIPLATTETLIAATAFASGATIATGNLQDYPMPKLPILPLQRPGSSG